MLSATTVGGGSGQHTGGEAGCRDASAPPRRRTGRFFDMYAISGAVAPQTAYIYRGADAA